MSYASTWLVEFDAHNGSGVVTYRLSDAGYATGPDDTPANTIYDAAIASIGEFAAHLYGDGRTMGNATVEMTDLTLSNADGALDALKDYAVDGRRIVLKRLASPRAPYSSAETVLTGTMEGVDASNGSLTLRVRFYDRRRDIDVPIQSEFYAGTTTGPGPTAEGAADMKGQVKPLAFGRCFSVPATIVNDYNMFLQFSASALNAIVLYDGGVPLINDGDVASLAALASATGNPGHYRTCLAHGIARPFGTFNGRPAYTWTADITEGATTADRRASAIVQRMLARIGETGSDNIDAASFSALQSLATQEIGIWIDRETTVLRATYDVLRSVGGFIVPDHLGRFTVGRLDAPGTPVATIIDPDILTSSSSETLSFLANTDIDGNVPTHSVLLNYRKNWHVHTDSDLGHCANFGDPARGSALKKEWREARIQDSSVLTRHLLSTELSIETFLVEQAAADAEAERRLALYGVNRDVVRVGVDREDAELMLLNTTVTLRTDRFGYGSGKAMRIIGRADDYQNEKAILTLWG